MFNQHFTKLFFILLTVKGCSTTIINAFISGSDSDKNNSLSIYHSQEIEDQNDKSDGHTFYPTIVSYIVNLSQHILRIIIQTLRIKNENKTPSDIDVDKSGDVVAQNALLTPLAIQHLLDQKHNDEKKDKIFDNNLLKQSNLNKLLTITDKDMQKDSSVINSAPVEEDDDCLFLFYFFVVCYILCILLLLYVLHRIVICYLRQQQQQRLAVQQQQQITTTADDTKPITTTILFKIKNYDNQLDGSESSGTLVEVLTPLLSRISPPQYEQSVAQSTPPPAYV
ncbi:unnamed protein product [Didymodactylos carnosus]|uniref:Uncharacterized protein n=1 Tax=Didymodactylos carnosus TaxID=1234261 RepID=A0A813Z3L3_9BILA|nr:unnamed protein product [Didymodactylos carnosus]CAF0892826.1 unnamed protein product [Didymodactylos carnosus]CAF3493927.1 unnamed protein product [Didymodactylos carnosus]CAF3676755.1 unnamed protein product [Didymodactylos carnosus]